MLALLGCPKLEVRPRTHTPSLGPSSISREGPGSPQGMRRPHRQGVGGGLRQRQCGPCVLSLVVMVARGPAQPVPMARHRAVGSTAGLPGAEPTSSQHVRYQGGQEQSDTSVAVTTSSTQFIITHCLRTSGQVSIHPQGAWPAHLCICPGDSQGPKAPPARCLWGAGMEGLCGCHIPVCPGSGTPRTHDHGLASSDRIGGARGDPLGTPGCSGTACGHSCHC